MKIHVSVSGCRLNEAEIEALVRAAVGAGHEVVEDPAAADWSVINTCTVTHVAARKSRQAIRRLHRANPRARLAVLGCYGEMACDEAASLPGVALVLPNADKESLLQRIGALADEPPVEHGPISALPAGRTRAFIKVQDGCDNLCTFCIVNVARGTSRSRLPQDVLRAVRERVAQGAQEVALSGVNIGAYGRDRAGQGPLTPDSGWSLVRLVACVLQDTGIRRLRLSSLEPWDVSDDLLALWPEPRLCRQLHLPLQSGSEAVIRRMGRPMAVAAYRDLAARAHARVPDLSLSTDLIVGFPGESDEDFAATCEVAAAVGFSRLHVFRYSPRQGTPAAEMGEQVPAAVAQARSRDLAALGARLAHRFHARFVSRLVDVLFETPVTREGVPGWSGLTDNYLRIWVACDGELHNQIRPVCCLAADATGLVGTLADDTVLEGA